MANPPSKSPTTAFDAAFSKALRKNYSQVTRRSFLSGLTRNIFSVAGIGVASQVLPFFAPEAKAQDWTQGAYCGLHGKICVANTQCYGGVVGYAWSACCKIPISTPPCPTVYVCCNYTDHCGDPLPNFNGCIGPEPSGQSWCGAFGFYRCTTFTCGASYNSMYACQQNCIPLTMGWSCF